MSFMTAVPPSHQTRLPQISGGRGSNVTSPRVAHAAPTPRQPLTLLEREEEKSHRRLDAFKAKCDDELATAEDLLGIQVRRARTRQLEAEVLRLHEEQQAAKLQKSNKVLGSLGSTPRPQKTARGSLRNTSPRSAVGMGGDSAATVQMAVRERARDCIRLEDIMHAEEVASREAKKMSLMMNEVEAKRVELDVRYEAKRELEEQYIVDKRNAETRKLDAKQSSSAHNEEQRQAMARQQKREKDRVEAMGKARRDAKDAKKHEDSVEKERKEAERQEALAKRARLKEQQKADAMADAMVETARRTELVLKEAGAVVAARQADLERYVLKQSLLNADETRGARGGKVDPKLKVLEDKLRVAKNIESETMARYVEIVKKVNPSMNAGGHD